MKSQFERPESRDQLSSGADRYGLDDLRLQNPADNTMSQQSSLIIEALRTELHPKKINLLMGLVLEERAIERRKADYDTVFRKMTKGIYFFLWSLQNFKMVPSGGIVTSAQLESAVSTLFAFILDSEPLLKSHPVNIRLLRNLGRAYFDLAGIAYYAPHRGFSLAKPVHYQFILRKAICCWQKAIQTEARLSQHGDASHVETLGLVEDNFVFERNRMETFVNPWYFLHIASALHLLNDEEASAAYLEKAGRIIGAIDSHQNEKIRQQRLLLESVYSTIKYSKTTTFDFDPKSLQKIDEQLQKIKQKGRSAGGQYPSHRSPLVDDALWRARVAKNEFINNGMPDLDKFSYLQSVSTLYEQVKSSKVRDRLIYQLSIPPLRIKGNPRHRTWNRFRQNPIGKRGVSARKSGQKMFKVPESASKSFTF